MVGKEFLRFKNVVFLLSLHGLVRRLEGKR